MEYASFGQILTQTNPAAADRFAFTGREAAVAGLYYYRARFYDPGTGRFTGEDRIRFAARDTNLYRYVANGPTNATDPSGEVVALEVRATLSLAGFALNAVGAILQFQSAVLGATGGALLSNDAAFLGTSTLAFALAFGAAAGYLTTAGTLLIGIGSFGIGL